MDFIITPRNEIEYKTRRKLMKGSFTVKHIDINLASDDPRDLSILKMHRHLIEDAIIENINKKFYFEDC